MVLKSTIEVDMPCLTAEMVKRQPSNFTSSVGVSSDKNASLLEGQISRWMIRLRNVGNAPATNITLKTNLPWVNIKSDRTSIPTEELEAQATSGCLGPTGTLVAIPVTNFSTESGAGHQLSETGAIHPGERVDIPVEIRTSGHGKQSFYMLYRYELKSSPGEEAKEDARHRWLRKMYEVPVSSIVNMNVFRQVVVIAIY